MPGFDDAFACVAGAEGGFTRDSRDPGNWTGGRVGVGALRGTRFGISAASFPSLDIANLTLDQAEAIYRSHYWAPIAGDALPFPVALVLFDCAVNQGVPTARLLLQAAIGVHQDGVIGPVTLAAARAANPAALAREILARRAVRYAAGDMASYGLGWMRRLFTLAARVAAISQGV